MSEISFTSKLTPISLSEFSRITGQFGKNNAVNSPWTLKESIKAPNVYTTNICDCSACLITDGQEALLIHLNPAIEKNHAFSQVLTFLRMNLNLKNNNLNAVLLGSKNNKRSLDIYNKFLELLKNLGMPVSEFKNGKKPTSIAYRSNGDEILITNKEIDKFIKRGESFKQALSSGFEKIFVADCDEIRTTSIFT